MDDYGYYYAKVDIDEPVINVLRRSLSSALLLFIALVAATLLYECSEAISLLALKYWVKFRFSEVRTVADYRKWNLLRVVVVYMAGPFMCMLMVVFSNTLYHRWQKMVHQSKLFFLWLLICCLNMVTTNMIEAPIGRESTSYPFYRSFAIIGAWMHMQSGPLMALLVIGLVINFFAGYFFSYRFLEFSNSSKLIHHRTGKVYVYFQVFILPVFFAAALYLPLGGSFNVLHFAIVMVSLLTFSLGFFVRSITDMSIVVCNKSDVLNKFSVIPAVITVVAWLIIFFTIR